MLERMARLAPPAAFLAALVLTGCANTDVYQSSSHRPTASRIGSDAALPTDAASSLGENVALLAQELIGAPYVYGGSDPRGFDCSGLVYYTYRQTGVNVPRTSQEQFKAARKIALTQANEGDLVFFQDQAKLSHVGIYLGEGMFVHAPETGRQVSIESLNAPYYQQHLVAVGRLVP